MALVLSFLPLSPPASRRGFEAGLLPLLAGEEGPLLPRSLGTRCLGHQAGSRGGARSRRVGVRGRGLEGGSAGLTSTLPQGLLQLEGKWPALQLLCVASQASAGQRDESGQQPEGKGQRPPEGARNRSQPGATALLLWLGPRVPLAVSRLCCLQITTLRSRIDQAQKQ